jgi:hypothetical protein
LGRMGGVSSEKKRAGSSELVFSGLDLSYTFPEPRAPKGYFVKGNYAYNSSVFQLLYQCLREIILYKTLYSFRLKA